MTTCHRNFMICLFKIDILRIFMMFEFGASGGAVSKKRLHQKRSLFSNCLVIAGRKFKHHKFLENFNFEETNDVVLILVCLYKKISLIGSLKNCFFDSKG